MPWPGANTPVQASTPAGILLQRSRLDFPRDGSKKLKTFGGDFITEKIDSSAALDKKKRVPSVVFFSCSTVYTDQQDRHTRGRSRDESIIVFPY